MVTRFDHIRKEAGLIENLPGRSEIMATNINVTFTGNLQGLIEFMEATFKNPNAMTLQVAATFSPVKATTPLEALALDLSRRLNCTVDSLLQGCGEYPKGLANAIELTKEGQKIGAIKCLRTLTNTGLKEAKDAVEGPITEALRLGKV